MTTELTATTKTSSPKNATNAASTKSNNKAKTTTKSERKKKHVNKKSSAASTTALYSAARVQYHKLLKQREAELNDHVWLSKESLPFGNVGGVAKLNGTLRPIAPDTAASSSTANTITSSTHNMMESPSFLEQDIEIVHRALSRNGLSLKDVTIDAFDALLEEARKYAMELITDAADCAIHSHGNDVITPDDLVIAKEMEADECCFALENMQEISKNARELNQVALPTIPDNCYNGIVLPDLEETLLNRSFDVICRKKNEDQIIISSTGGSKDMKNLQSMSMLGTTTDGSSIERSEMNSGSVSAYGAKRGSKQMQILLKKSLSEPQVHPTLSHPSSLSNEKNGNAIKEKEQVMGTAGTATATSSSLAAATTTAATTTAPTTTAPTTTAPTTTAPTTTAPTTTAPTTTTIEGRLQESKPTTAGSIHDKDQATNPLPDMAMENKHHHHQETLPQQEQQPVPPQEKQQLGTLPDADFMDLS